MPAGTRIRPESKRHRGEQRRRIPAGPPAQSSRCVTGKTLDRHEQRHWIHIAHEVVSMLGVLTDACSLGALEGGAGETAVAGQRCLPIGVVPKRSDRACGARSVVLWQRLWEPSAPQGLRGRGGSPAGAECSRCGRPSDADAPLDRGRQPHRIGALRPAFPAPPTRPRDAPHGACCRALHCLRAARARERAPACAQRRGRRQKRCLRPRGAPRRRGPRRGPPVAQRAHAARLGGGALRGGGRRFGDTGSAEARRSHRSERAGGGVWDPQGCAVLQLRGISMQAWLRPGPSGGAPPSRR